MRRNATPYIELSSSSTAIGARIVSAFDIALRVDPDAACVPEDFTISSRHHFNVVTGFAQGIDQFGRETVLHTNVVNLRAPGLAEDEARTVDRLGDRHPLLSMARVNRGIRLRLAVAAHRTEGKNAAVGKLSERRA